MLNASPLGAVSLAITLIATGFAYGVVAVSFCAVRDPPGGCTVTVTFALAIPP